MYKSHLCVRHRAHGASIGAIVAASVGTRLDLSQDDRSFGASHRAQQSPGTGFVI